MVSIKKQVYILIGISVVLLSLLLVFASKVPPRTDTAVPVLVVLMLIYLLSSSLIALVFTLSTGKSWLSHATMTFLLACIPPAFIMIASLRQATAIDLFILFFTIVVIAWYATYKK
jgi:hypothetical protein